MIGKKESNGEKTGPQEGAAFEGFVNVPADGDYLFTITSDSGVVLWIHDSLVIDDDYTHDDAPRSGSVRLPPAGIRCGSSTPRAREFAARLDVAVHGPGFDHDSLTGDLIGCEPSEK